MSAQPLYNIQRLHHWYRLGEESVHALRGVTLDIPRRGILCFRGPSGSGKTTLLNLLGLIEPVQEGTLFFEGQDVAGYPEARKNFLRRHVLAFVFQEFHLNPILTARENVEFFLARQGLRGHERLQRAEEALDLVDLLPERHHRPQEMSGGQQQRVAIARAIAKNPDVILADEPTAALDQENGIKVMEIFRSLQQRRSCAILIASHDSMVHELSDRVIRLRDGNIEGG